MNPARKINPFSVFLGLTLTLATTSGWSQTNSNWPFPSRLNSLSTPAPRSEPPNRDVRLVEKPFQDLTNQNVAGDGKLALTIDPVRWKHAETDNFVLHYRRVTEAQKVAREVEYNLWYIANTLGADKERYARKSHVYIFEDEAEWKQFLAKTAVPDWSSSFARGDELYLNVRRASTSGNFDSLTLAHETSHAVVARIFPGKRWPLWLNEGFAEYMGGASVAARKGQTVKRFQTRLHMAEMPLSLLETMTVYPSDELQVGQLYQTSEKFVRFLMNELPKDRITKFIDSVLSGNNMQTAVLEVYGDKFKDWDSFQRRYERFVK